MYATCAACAGSPQTRSPCWVSVRRKATERQPPRGLRAGSLREELARSCTVVEAATMSGDGGVAAATMSRTHGPFSSQAPPTPPDTSINAGLSPAPNVKLNWRSR